MKAKLRVLFSIGMLWTMCAGAQTSTEMVYLDGLMKATSQEKSSYKLQLNKVSPDVYEGKIYDFTGEVKAVGRYIRINKKVLEDGHFIYYYANGQTESEGELHFNIIY
jgi:hypothetical protein